MATQRRSIVIAVLVLACAVTLVASLATGRSNGDSGTSPARVGGELNLAPGRAPVDETSLQVHVAGVKDDDLSPGDIPVEVNRDAGSRFSPECVKCLSTSCAEVSEGCDGMTGIATDGPAEGVLRSTLCRELLSCATSTHCGKSDLSVCYCGTPLSADCIEGRGPTGPCKLAFERALEASSPIDVPVRFTNATFGGGAALNLLQCASDHCSSCL